MRKLKLQIQMTIDGYVGSLNGRMKWMVWDYGEDWAWDDELKKYHTEMIATSDCILLSRPLAEGGFIDHWDSVAVDAENPQSVFAKNVSAARKIIFSKRHTLKKPKWKNTELAKKDLVTEVNLLKQEPGKDIIVYGGASFVSALIEERLIDEYHFVINPAIMGEGLPIFREVGSMLDLRLVSAQAYPCGVGLMIYAMKPLRK